MEIDRELALEASSKESVELKSINSINTQYMLNDTVEGFSAEDEAELVKEFQSSKESFLKNFEIQNATNFLIEDKTVKQSPLLTHDHITYYKSMVNDSGSHFVKMIKSIDNFDKATVYKSASTVEKRLNGRNVVTKNICNKRKGYNGKKSCKKCNRKHANRERRTNPRMHVMMDDLSLVLAVKLRMTDKK